MRASGAAAQSSTHTNNNANNSSNNINNVAINNTFTNNNNTNNSNNNNNVAINVNNAHIASVEDRVLEMLAFEQTRPTSSIRPKTAYQLFHMHRVAELKDATPGGIKHHDAFKRAARDWTAMPRERRDFFFRHASVKATSADDRIVDADAAVSPTPGLADSAPPVVALPILSAQRGADKVGSVVQSRNSLGIDNNKNSGNNSNGNNNGDSFCVDIRVPSVFHDARTCAQCDNPIDGDSFACFYCMQQDIGQ